MRVLIVEDDAALGLFLQKGLKLEGHDVSWVGDGEAALVHAAERAEKVVAAYEKRIAAIQQKTAALTDRPRVFCMEWVKPAYCGGHWMKKLVEIAGGVDDLANPEKPSYRIEWDRVLEFSPEVMVLTCCGYKLPKVIQEAKTLLEFDGIVPTSRFHGRSAELRPFSRPRIRACRCSRSLKPLFHTTRIRCS